MSASHWFYLVAYRQDISNAFKDLRNQIFEEGKYRLDWDELEEDKPRPQSIEELLEIVGTDGTHSIIDIERVLNRPVTKEEWESSQHQHYSKYNLLSGGGVVSPVSAANLMKIFGTDKPTRTDFKQLLNEIIKSEGNRFKLLENILPGKYHGVYIIIYKDDLPEEIFFYGFSGD